MVYTIPDTNSKLKEIYHQGMHSLALGSGDKAQPRYNLQESLNQLSINHGLSIVSLYIYIWYAYIYGNRQNYGKQKKTFNLDRRRLRPIFP